MPRAGLGRVLVLELVLSPENKPHICLQLLCGFSLAPAGFAHLRQRGEMPQSRSPPRKAHAFQPKHWLSLLCLVRPAPAPPAQRPSPRNLQNSYVAREGQACVHHACRAAWSLCPGSGPPGAREGLAAAGWGDLEQSPQNICLSLTAEPCSAEKRVCRALLACNYSSTSQEGHLPCCCNPHGVTGHPWL